MFAVELEKLIRELESYSAQSTVLLSLYIPPGYSISKVVQQLVEEYGTAENIKTKKTRGDVKAAISRAMEVLKRYRKTPENGLVVFSGNVSREPGRDDVRVWVIEPPAPVPVKLYRTDKRFVLGPLKELLEDDEVYGLVVVEKDHGTVGVLAGRRIVLLDEVTGLVPGKTRAGGQSARRYERLREQAVHEFFKRFGRRVGEALMPYYESGRLAGIIVGGPAYAKEDFLKGDYLDYRLRDAVVGLVDTSYQGEYGLRELVERAANLLREQEYVKERKLVEEFIGRVVRGDACVAYGAEEVKRAAEWGAVEVLLVSEGRDDVDFYRRLGRELGFEVFVVSSDTEEGRRFSAFGGLGALLRFPLLSSSRSFRGSGGSV